MRLGIEMSGSDDATKDGMITDIEEMDRIISQFLDFARVDGGEAMAPASVGTLVADIAAHYHKLGQEIATDIGVARDVPLRALAMRRVISNLIDNALRYGETGIAVAVREEAANVIVEVSDRGPGIPAADAERMKQPFTRLETARSGKGGSGLGLAIVDRIVRAHGGSFDLLPRDGGGLCARISLPVGKGSKAA
jgi:two-component system osmolarity sensor histidine kinase EnvZ